MAKRLNVTYQDTAHSAAYILNTGCEDLLDILTTIQLQPQAPAQNRHFPQSSEACQTTAFVCTPGNYSFAAYKGMMIQRYQWIWLIAK